VFKLEDLPNGSYEKILDARVASVEAFDDNGGVSSNKK